MGAADRCTEDVSPFVIPSAVPGGVGQRAALQNDDHNPFLEFFILLYFFTNREDLCVVKYRI